MLGKNTYRWGKSISKNIFRNQACYIPKSAYASSSRLKNVICFIKGGLGYIYQKGGLDWYIKEFTFKIINKDLFFR